MLRNQHHKLWCAGPMFRYEKPQKGRYRQFHQFDVEALGYAGPDIDAELIIMMARAWRELGISHVELQLNSLGMPEGRARYRQELARYFQGRVGELDEDSRRRLERNPLRILDSKNPAMQDVVAGAPVMAEFLDEESATHFATVQRLLAQARNPVPGEPAPGPGPGLLQPHRIRMGHRPARHPGSGLRRRALRWPRGAARRHADTGRSAAPSAWSGWSSCSGWRGGAG